ncbi:hypothetical protein AYR66_07395 [Noviherbaspirillum denitrificans]|uniref:Uncharacterized protein n=1 Tax=Noviherbaspirillum denitrificans TaxID=1968433 RepID=A0A254T9N7_9BURK|nr:hypothetical protein AYR66_07395 [Noviherbaspirillum denitrificans]
MLEFELLLAVVQQAWKALRQQHGLGTPACGMRLQHSSEAPDVFLYFNNLLRLGKPHEIAQVFTKKVSLPRRRI